MKTSIISVLFVLMFCACQQAISQPNVESSSPTATKVNAPLVDEKYSIKEDREKFEELRKNIPPEQQRQNDELAAMESFFSDSKKNPTDVRARFQKIISKKRDLFNKDMTKQRESYVKNERKMREDFVKSLEKERQAYVSDKKQSREQRKEFFDQLDLKRKDFFSSQKEKRDEFEANARDARKNFEDYIKEKTDTFNQEHKAFVKKHEEEKRQATQAKPGSR